MNKTKYRPDKELILTSNTNKLPNLLNKDIKKKDYDSIREIVEDKQEIICNTKKENKVKKILPPDATQSPRVLRDARQSFASSRDNNNKKKYKNNCI